MKHSLLYFIVLALILGFGGLSLIAFRGQQQMQLLSGILTVIAYIAWGMYHHVSIGDVHKRIVVEYILIGSIAILLLDIVLGF